MYTTSVTTSIGFGTFTCMPLYNALIAVLHQLLMVNADWLLNSTMGCQSRPKFVVHDHVVRSGAS